jgi:hypothetical protein
MKMGEAKRKAAVRARTWATGSITVSANDSECFRWSGTKREAIELQKRYLATVNALSPVDAHSYAKRAAGYLITFGMPRAGDIDQRPSHFGKPWNGDEIELYKAAVLWLALRQPLPNTADKLEGVFVGKSLLVEFIGEAKGILENTARELRGEPFRQQKFQMIAAVLDELHQLDPRQAVSMEKADLFALACKPVAADDRFAGDLIYVPRIPLDATEAEAMLRMITVTADATNPSAGVRLYAGYTDEELFGGKSHMRVR